MYQVIARKYRPQTFSELIGQEHVKTTLENAIKQHRIAHGYIFSGQRGTGKTTVARILARCLNCEQGPTATPCGKCASCLEIAAGSGVDVIEIDAASNRGINEMRELRENVRYRPARDRYKVFIVDEAHQITNEAFNALLKTLEEPPEWVVFILCTTEAHKIPSTIVSRCQQFSFRSVDFAELVERMEWIAKQEGIEASPEVWSVLAQAGEGSVRDSLSALDQAIACCGAKLDEAEVRGLLGMFSLDSLGQVAQALVEGDSRRMLEVAAELEANGRSLQHFARELARYFRNLLVIKIAGGVTKLVAASPNEQSRLAETAAQFGEEDLTRYLQLTLDLFRDLQSSLQPRLHLEIGLIRMVYAGKLLPIEEALAEAGGSPAPRGSGSASIASPSTGPVGTAGASRAISTPASKAVATNPASALKRPVSAAPIEPASAPSRALADRDTRSRLHAALMDAKQIHVADALEHSSLDESANELVITTPKMYVMYLKQAEFEAAVRRVLGKPVKITIKAGEVAAGQAAPITPATAAAASAADRDTRDTREPGDEAAARALAHPDVRRFQEIFPDSQVRKVRNLKEG
jgi:DNA polymerase-3 subunit gamma/tau